MGTDYDSLLIYGWCIGNKLDKLLNYIYTIKNPPTFNSKQEIIDLMNTCDNLNKDEILSNLEDIIKYEKNDYNDTKEEFIENVKDNNDEEYVEKFLEDMNLYLIRYRENEFESEYYISYIDSSYPHISTQFILDKEINKDHKIIDMIRNIFGKNIDANIYSLLEIT